MAIIVSHPTGNQNVRAVIGALELRKQLAGFFTTLAIDPNSLWLRAIPKKVRQELIRRSFLIQPEHLLTHPWLELTRMFIVRAGLGSYIRHESGWASVDAVYKNLDKTLARKIPYLVQQHNISAVYAYEDGALDTFIKAKSEGLDCIYDLPIAYWETGRRLMLEEVERLPLWAKTLGGGVMDSPSKLERKTKELELADIIVGPSNFVLDSLPHWASNKQIVLAPFGSPKGNQFGELNRELSIKDLGHPLRVLFVGSMSQRKGLGDLFDAMRLLNNPNIELVVMGSLQAPMDFYKSEFSDFTYEPNRPHNEVLELMQSCDVFCLPSIVEGRALVMQEAMSQGLPLIITSNTGGADLIIERETGFLIPIRAPEIIAEKLTWFLENRSEIPKMSEMAQKIAAKYTWEKYSATIVNAIIS